MKLVKSDLNRRIPAICERRTCYLMWNNLCIAEISEERNDALEVDWVIKVRWEEWEKAGKRHIPGIFEELHLEEYIRIELSYVVEQRTLNDCRKDLKAKLKKLGLKYNDRFEYMCLTRGICGNNDYYIGRTPTDFINYNEWAYSNVPRINPKKETDDDTTSWHPFSIDNDICSEMTISL